MQRHTQLASHEGATGSNPHPSSRTRAMADPAPFQLPQLLVLGYALAVVGNSETACVAVVATTDGSTLV
ncbi:hypothetical protein R6Q59_006276 [Mikania micrantha]